MNKNSPQYKIAGYRFLHRNTDTKRGSLAFNSYLANRRGHRTSYCYISDNSGYNGRKRYRRRSNVPLAAASINPINRDSGIT